MTSRSFVHDICYAMQDLMHDLSYEQWLQKTRPVNRGEHCRLRISGAVSVINIPALIVMQTYTHLFQLLQTCMVPHRDLSYAYYRGVGYDDNCSFYIRLSLLYRTIQQVDGNQSLQL
jgi:hypothetical protein